MGTRLYITLAFDNVEMYANLLNVSTEAVEVAEKLIEAYRNHPISGDHEEGFALYSAMNADPVAAAIDHWRSEGVGKLTSYDYAAIEALGLDRVGGIISNRDAAIPFLVGHLATKGFCFEHINWAYVLSMLTSVNWG